MLCNVKKLIKLHIDIMVQNLLFRISTLALAFFTNAIYGHSPITWNKVLEAPCKSIKAQEQSVQDFDADNIYNMLSEADILFRSGKKSEAAQLGEGVLKLAREHYDDNSKDMAFTLCHVATYYNGYDTQKALEYGKKALLTMENISDAKKGDFFIYIMDLPHHINFFPTMKMPAFIR